MKTAKKITPVQKLVAILFLFVIISLIFGFEKKFLNSIESFNLSPCLIWVILYLFVVLIFGIIYLVRKIITTTPENGGIKSILKYGFGFFSFITLFYLALGVGGCFQLCKYLTFSLLFFSMFIFFFYNSIIFKKKIDSNIKFSFYAANATYSTNTKQGLFMAKVFIYIGFIASFVFLVISLALLYVFLSNNFF